MSKINSKTKVQPRSAGDPVYEGITITHPDRIVFPKENYTKADVAAYYNQVADLILPYLEGRPLSIIRCPDGLVKSCFFQRHIHGRSAEWITQLRIKEESSGEPYFAANDKKALLSLVQFGAIEFHPWGSKAPRFEKADRIVFDLDPDPKVDFLSLKSAAFLIRKRLQKQGLKSFVKTTGGKGLHVVAPITPKYGWDAVKAFTRQFVQELEAEYPEAFTSNTLKAKRKGKIFLDYLRNDRTSTAIAAFSLRARPGAPVSMPLSWAKLKTLSTLDVAGLHSANGNKRSDPWKGMPALDQQIPVPKHP